jgi:hypothetical protein
VHDEPIAPQDSITICKKNSKGTHISIPIELPKNNVEDSFMKLGDFFIDMNHVKELKESIQPRKLFMRINLLKKLEEKMKRKPNIIQFGSMPAMEIT